VLLSGHLAAPSDCRVRVDFWTSETSSMRKKGHGELASVLLVFSSQRRRPYWEETKKKESQPEGARLGHPGDLAKIQTLLGESICKKIDFRRGRNI